jgi:hypothetical protein
MKCLFAQGPHHSVHHTLGALCTFIMHATIEKNTLQKKCTMEQEEEEEEEFRSLLIGRTGMNGVSVHS